MLIISITYHNITGMKGRLRVQATIPCPGFALIADILRVDETAPRQLTILTICSCFPAVPFTPLFPIT